MEIPSLNRRGVLPTVGPQARVSEQAPDLGVGTLARGVEAATGDLVKLQALAQAKADRAELVGLEAALTTHETEILTKVQQARGRDGMGVRGVYLPDYDRVYGELSKSVTSPKVMAAFTELATQRRANLERGLARHEVAQSTVYFDAQTEAQVKSQRDAVAANPLDEEARALAMGRMAWALEDKAARDGMPAEAKTQLLKEGRSDIHRAAITGMVNVGRYAEASAHYNANKTDMVATDIGAVDGVVREGMVRSEGTSQADALMAQYGAGMGALNAARNIQDPDVRKAVEENISRRISQNETMINIGERRAADAAWDLVEKNGGTWKPDLVPADIWMTVPGPVREAIKNSAVRNTPTAAGSQAYWEMRNGLVNEATRDAFVNDTGLWKKAYAEGLTETQVNSLMSLQEGLKVKDAGALAEADGIQTNVQIVDRALVKMGFDPKTKALSSQKTITQFRDAVDLEVATLERDQKHKATGQQIKEIAERLQIDMVYTDDWGKDDPVPYSMLPEEDLESAYVVVDEQQYPVSIVPAPDRIAITRELTRAGFPATQKLIVETYVRHMKSKGAGRR